MITETIYEHLKDIYNSKVATLISPAIEIDSSFTVSKVMNQIFKNNVYDVFCPDGNSVLTTNVRALLAGKDISDMNIRPFLSPISSLSRNDLVQKAANIIALNRIRAVPLVENNKIIGGIFGKIEKDMGIINYLTLPVEEHGKGYGAMLIQKVTDELGAKNIKIISLKSNFS